VRTLIIKIHDISFFISVMSQVRFCFKINILGGIGLEHGFLRKKSSCDGAFCMCVPACEPS